MDPEAEALLLSCTGEDDSVQGATDHRGRLSKRPSSARWTSASLSIGVEVAERVAFYGVSSNLIMYLTNHLGEPTTTAAINANTWNRAALMLPLLGGLVADSCLGRYTTVVAASCLYLVCGVHH